MNAIKPLAIAATLALMTGCATTDGLFKSGPESEGRVVSAEDKTQARQGAVRAGIKGCGMGAVVGALGGLLGGAGAAQSAIAGCLGGGISMGLAEYQSQLKEARELQGKVSVGAIATVKEKDVQVEGKQAKALDQLRLDLDAKKVADRNPDIAVVVGHLATMLNKQAREMTVRVSGSQAERDWLIGSLKAKVTNGKVSIVHGDTGAPVIVVSPMPALD